MRADSLYGDGSVVRKKTSLARTQHNSKRGGGLTAAGSQTGASQPVYRSPRADRSSPSAGTRSNNGTQADIRNARSYSASVPTSSLSGPKFSLPEVVDILLGGSGDNGQNGKASALSGSNQSLEPGTLLSGATTPKEQQQQTQALRNAQAEQESQLLDANTKSKTDMGIEPFWQQVWDLAGAANPDGQTAQNNHTRGSNQTPAEVDAENAASANENSTSGVYSPRAAEASSIQTAPQEPKTDAVSSVQENWQDYLDLAQQTTFTLLDKQQMNVAADTLESAVTQLENEAGANPTDEQLTQINDYKALQAIFSELSTYTDPVTAAAGGALTAFPLNIISKAAEKNAQENNIPTLSLDSDKLVASALGSSDSHYYSDDVDAVLKKIGKGNDYANTTYTSSPIAWKTGALATNLALLKGADTLAGGIWEAIPELSSAGRANAGADALLNDLADSDASLSAAGAQGAKLPVDIAGESGYAGSGNPIINGVDALKQARAAQPALASYTGPLPLSDVADYLTKVISGNGATGATGSEGDESLDSDILIDSYKNMRNNPNVTGQSHHLNQDAAFRDVIPKNDGLCVELEGNAFRDVGSPHYSAHKNLESFWNNFRSKGDLYGDTPKISDYNSALYDSLRAAGLSDAQAKIAVQNAVKQQSQYGLVGDSFVPRIPGRINFKR
jgi:hypothetical protein